MFFICLLWEVGMEGTGRKGFCSGVVFLGFFGFFLFIFYPSIKFKVFMIKVYRFYSFIF